jgi:hypothetical protein
MLELGGDYLLFTDGDIEIVPFSSFAMLRHMENSGHLLGCLGADSYRHTLLREQATNYLFSLSDCQLDSGNLVAWTQYGMFRRQVFEAGVRFDDHNPFNEEGWGCEDNDLAFQMHIKGYYIQRLVGITYLHRHMHSSVRVMRTLGVDPHANFERRKQYVIRKWASTPVINSGPLEDVRRARLPAQI